MKIKETKKHLIHIPVKPITIQELILEIRKILTENLCLTLREAGIESRFILEHALKVSHQYLISNYEQLIDANKLKQIMELVSDRISNKPLAYILKEWKFYDIELYIDSNVLIPRQDTELLIDLIINKYNKYEEIDILDLGTGSGAIGIALGKNFQNAEILLSDISFKALNIANKNILRHKLKNISVIQSDWLANIANKKFDIIVSNPPYIDKSDPHLKNTELLYEPQDALISEKEGYGDILEIVRHSPRFLKQKGALYIEHGYNQHEKIHQLFLDNDFINIKQCEDLNGVIRATSGNIKI
jgi:release factor glutamine methyltransferase